MLPFNEGQKYCRMLQEEHSAILSTFIKLPFVFETFILSTFKWPLKTGFTEVYLFFLQYSAQLSSNSLIFNKGALEMNLIGEVMEDHTLDGIIRPFGWTNKSVLSKLWVFLTFLWVSLVLDK